MPSNTIFIMLVLGAAGVLYWWYNKQHAEGGSSGEKGGPVLETYTRDLTKEAQGKQLDPVIGREKEIDRMIHILTRRQKNNPLLLGEPGVGKTAIVEGIARKIVAGDVPDNLKGKRVLALDLGSLISGTKYRGEFEERMKKLTDEIKKTNREIILFIDEIHMIEQAKGAEGAMNASDILKPALSRGELQAIGATTLKEYEAFIKPDDALNRRFQPVIVGEPSNDASLLILRGIKDAYEKHHGVMYEDDALKAAITLSALYIHDRFLPDKAIDLMDEAGAKIAISAGHENKHVAALLHAAGQTVVSRTQTIDADLKSLKEELGHLRALEGRMTEESEVKEIRVRIEHLVTEIEKLRTRSAEAIAGKLPLVTVEDIREIVIAWTGKKPEEIVLH